jgi:hypothetical protein
MRLRLPNGPVDSAVLSQVFGFHVPPAFVNLMGVLYQESYDDGDLCYGLFEKVFGLELAGANARYTQTPPELCPFAALGVDGVHYGYVMHAPELGADDYPVGEICPTDDEGVIFVGNNTLEASENLLSHWMEFKPEETRSTLYIGEKLGLHPAAEKANRRYEADGKVVPNIPAGWHHVPSADGVGVLAPQDTFSLEPYHMLPYFEPQEYMHIADEMFNKGFPATALLYLREGYWYNWTNASAAQELLIRMMRTYDVLGRQFLTNVIEQKFSGYRRKHGI